MESAELLDIGNNEFLCPLCRRLGNTLLPALKPPSHPSCSLPNQTSPPPPLTGASEVAGKPSKDVVAACTLVCWVLVYIKVGTY